MHSLRAADTDDDSGYAQISLFAKAIQLIRQDYVDGSKVSYHDLIYAAMRGMLASLDPHSGFMDPSDFRDMQDDTPQSFQRPRCRSLGQERIAYGGDADGRNARGQSRYHFRR